jgi:hypothetical protein
LFALSSEIAVAAPTSAVVTRLDRVIQYAAAFRLITNVSGILGRPVKPGDDSFCLMRTYCFAI